MQKYQSKKWKEARDIENSLNSGSYKLVDIEEKESIKIQPHHLQLQHYNKKQVEK